MSIRPVDLQVMIPKTTDIANNQHHMTVRQDLQHQASANAVEQQVENHMKNVYAADESSKGKIQEKQNRQQGGKKKKNNKKMPEMQGEQKDNIVLGENTAKSNMIDILI